MVFIMDIQNKICDFCGKKYEIFPTHYLGGEYHYAISDYISVTINGIQYPDLCKACTGKIKVLRKVRK